MRLKSQEAREIASGIAMAIVLAGLAILAKVCAR